MSDYQQKDMEGVLFKNERKQEGESYPDYQGTITIKGVKFNLGAWINTSKKSGKKFMSLRVKPFQEKKPSPKAPPPANDFQDDDLGDVPF